MPRRPVLTPTQQQASPYYRLQRTIGKPVMIQGTGLHSGKMARLTLVPAEPNAGVWFRRLDVPSCPEIRAHHRSVVDTQLATTLGAPNRHTQNVATVSTVEHLLAATYGMGISNLEVLLEGPEIPILDGSSMPFVDLILDAGLVAQPFSRTTLRVTKAIKIFQGGAICELLPRSSFRLTTSVDFPHPAIGLQTFASELSVESFRSDIAEARTFGFVDDLERLRANQRALGASVENVLAFDSKGIVNKEGARFPDEVVRHKLLDALGDMALCDAWLEGELVSFRGGHGIHSALLRSLENYPSHVEYLPAEPLRVPMTARENLVDLPVFH